LPVPFVMKNSNVVSPASSIVNGSPVTRAGINETVGFSLSKC
jgi:hypothetical protein